LTTEPLERRMSGVQLAEALGSLGMSINDAARAWNVDRRRATRWVMGEEDIPGWVPVLLHVVRTLLRTKHRLEERTGVTMDTRAADAALYLATDHDYHHHSPTPAIVRETDQADESSRDMD
jgi:hypothetical protein